MTRLSPDREQRIREKVYKFNLSETNSDYTVLLGEIDGLRRDLHQMSELLDQTLKERDEALHRLKRWAPEDRN